MPYLKIGSLDSGGYIKFTNKYIKVWAEGVVSKFILWLQSYSFVNLWPMLNFKISKFQNFKPVAEDWKSRFRRIC